ncbi:MULTISPECIES: D-2-hydroxyacid dehydrogenase [Halobacterium]|uniref:D-2-hydroxyacid dehydrogenase n=1 Tax=Halobacterium TaxID=2239 RepID=UPI00073EBF35|nr:MULTISPECIES: D-2-hydroxyacid dehydrogenase [Halobacterium]MCG1003225.1 D-2-hydroxyacid dehydrogenase [Halobacterium noricense]
MAAASTIDRIAILEWGDHPCPPKHLRDQLSGLGCEVVVRDVADLADCDGAVTVYHHDEFLDSVEWVHTIRSGYEDFPLDAYEDRDITLTNSTGIAGDLVAETAIGLLMMQAKGLHRYRDRQNDADWERIPWQRPFELGQSSVCVVGLGALGGSVATRAGVLGMDVWGVDVRPVSSLGLDRVYDVGRVSEAVADARFVVLTTPLLESTRGLIGADELEAMREDAFLVNVSRGEIVDQDALVAALESGEIAGAALDVFATEPLPDDSPLWEMEEVIATPHAAAQSDNYGEKVGRLVATNARCLNGGRDPWNRIV